MKVLVTGASSGIGRATAKLLIEQGHEVMGTARRIHRLEEFAAELLPNFKPAFQWCPLDVTSKASIDSFFNGSSDWLATMDALVNSAGLALGTAPFETALPVDARRMIDTNIWGLCEMTQRVIPFLKARSAGHIINIGSIAGIEAYKGGAVYCATKAAVHMFTEGLRRDLGGTGIRICNIEPGKVETEFSLVRFHGDQELAAPAYKGYRPLQAQDIAQNILWVLNQPRHINLQQVLITATDQVSATELEPVQSDI